MWKVCFLFLSLLIKTFIPHLGFIRIILPTDRELTISDPLLKLLQLLSLSILMGFVYFVSVSTFVFDLFTFLNL